METEGRGALMSDSRKIMIEILGNLKRNIVDHFLLLTFSQAFIIIIKAQKKCFITVFLKPWRNRRTSKNKVLATYIKLVVHGIFLYL